MRRKCSHCGKVRTVKYQFGGDNYCSEPCAACDLHIYSVYECVECGRRFNETEPERIFKRTLPLIVHLTDSVPVYCSLECALKAKGCVKVSRNYEPEQDNATDN